MQSEWPPPWDAQQAATPHGSGRTRLLEVPHESAQDWVRYLGKLKDRCYKHCNNRYGLGMVNSTQSNIDEGGSMRTSAIWWKSNRPGRFEREYSHSKSEQSTLLPPGVARLLGHLMVSKASTRVQNPENVV